MPLSYLWSNGEKSLSIQNLGPGDYSVTITDSNGCTLEEIYTLKAPPVIQKEQIIIPESCKGLNNGVFELTQLSGEPEICQYIQWSGSYSTTIYLQ